MQSLSMVESSQLSDTQITSKFSQDERRNNSSCLHLPLDANMLRALGDISKEYDVDTSHGLKHITIPFAETIIRTQTFYI